MKDQRVVKYVYPGFECFRDLGFFRLSGAGLANCLISYFHAYIYARRIGARVVNPPWPSLKIGPILRRERSKRSYLGLMRPGMNDVYGVRKAVILFDSFARRKAWRPIDVPLPAQAWSNGKLAIVSCREYTFTSLKPWRNEIRSRILEIATPPVPLAQGWGKGAYIAVHVRLGDFAVASSAKVQEGLVSNLRVPLDWYVNIVKKLRDIVPELPIYVFSDGSDQELYSLTSIDGVEIRRERSDLSDLIALSGASILVGSQSTYSRLAAFLGNMPSIWLNTKAASEKYSEDNVPSIYIEQDLSHLTRIGLLGA